MQSTAYLLQHSPKASRIVLASRICCCTQVDTSHVTEQRYCKTNLVVSVLPAPLSPEMTHDCEWNDFFSSALMDCFTNTCDCDLWTQKATNRIRKHKSIRLSTLKVHQSHLVLIVVDDVSVCCFSKREHMGLQQAQLLSVIFVDVILARMRIKGMINLICLINKTKRARARLLCNLTEKPFYGS